MVVDRYGELKFSGQHAYSYAMIVGKVWPNFKMIVWNEDALNNSQTTRRHLQAVKNSAFDLKDYLYLPTRNKDMEENPCTLVQARWNNGNEMSVSEVKDALDFYKFLTKNKNREAIMREYVALKTDDERGAMRGGMELAREALE